LNWGLVQLKPPADGWRSIRLSALQHLRREPYQPIACRGSWGGDRLAATAAPEPHWAGCGTRINKREALLKTTALSLLLLGRGATPVPLF